MKKIIVLNVGSSSCKFQIFTENLELIGKGMIDRIGFETGKIEFKNLQNQQVINKEETIKHDQLANYFEKFVTENKILNFSDVSLMVHRVVNGGELFRQNVIVDKKEILNKIKSLAPLAPLHQLFNVLILEAVYDKYPEIKHVAVFDTTFHVTIPEENYLYPLPRRFYQKEKIRKYGAHGNSHGYITELLEKHLKKEKVNFINLHIGNGASICLIKDSKSFDTTMGLTPLGGLIMGTRTGDLDPSIAFYLINQKGYDPKTIEEIFNKQSGLLAISQSSSDMRDIISKIESGDQDAALARKMFAKAIRKYLASYLCELSSPDAIVFTAGIGENDIELIKEIFNNFNVKKIILKKDFNNQEQINLISEKNSEIDVYIIKTNEELYMAKIAKKIISQN